MHVQNTIAQGLHRPPNCDSFWRKSTLGANDLGWMVILAVADIGTSSWSAFKPISSTLKGILDDAGEIGDVGEILVL